MIASILGNSSNKNFNAFQSIIGFFCDSKRTPEIIYEMLAHMGVSASLGGTRNMVKSLCKHTNTWLKTLPPCNMIYDNFDMDFKVAQPVAGHQGTHMSATAATFAPYASATPDDLRFTKELHKTSIFNKDLHPDDPRIYKPTAFDLLPQREPAGTSEDESMSSVDSDADPLNSLGKSFAWHMRSILVEREPRFEKYRHHCGAPDVVDALPIQKTVQFPANAINADEGQNDGNWEVLKSLLDQVSDHSSTQYPVLTSTKTSTADRFLEDSLVLVHGDLATKERIDTLCKMRTIEHTAKNRLDWVLFVPGMFHLKMACADATGFFEYIRHLRPRETGKFTSSPGFRRMHDAIHHTTWADILDCWRTEAQLLGFASLDKFADSDPEWDVIERISHKMIRTYLPGPNFQDIREGPDSERNIQFENQVLRKQHSLMYLEFSHAMNHGDVGRILRLFPYWIAIFTATGKHKYAAHMTKFKTDLNHVYPPRLR